jgi:starch synthase
MKSAIDSSDAVIVGDQEAHPELIEYAKNSGKPFLDYQGDEDYYVKYNEFYDKIIES